MTDGMLLRQVAVIVAFRNGRVSNVGKAYDFANKRLLSTKFLNYAYTYPSMLCEPSPFGGIPRAICFVKT